MSEWSYEQLLSDNAMYRKRIAELEKVAEAANNLMEGRYTITGVLRTPLSTKLDAALRNAGYLKEQG